MESRGGITGGPTLTDYLSGYASEGYDGSFMARAGGTLECCGCGERIVAERVPLHSIRRVEGVSDPDDMAAVAALECPSCGKLGTATFCIGTMCPPEDGAILKALDNRRPSAMESQRSDDPSLVSDTGWLPGRGL